MAGGRPTKYSQKMLDKANEYVDGAYRDDGSVIPTVEGLANYLQVVVSTVENWGNDKNKPEFLGALKRLKQSQKLNLMNNALQGTYNPTIAKLILSANHGMNEKTETDHTSSDGSMKMPTSIVLEAKE